MVTMTRMIRATKMGLMAMPTHYDPAAVTAEDARHDAAICSAAAELGALRDASETLWDMAAETAETAARRKAAEEASEDALDAWSDAVRAVEDGDVAGAVESLRSAAALAKEWGDDQHERRALAMLEGCEAEAQA